jgi:hypothetical protein
LDVPKALAGASLPLRPYGLTGLHVTALGFGAMQAGAPEIPDADAARLLHGALDLGIRLIDTARAWRPCRRARCGSPRTRARTTRSTTRSRRHPSVGRSAP